MVTEITNQIGVNMLDYEKTVVKVLGLITTVIVIYIVYQII